MHLNHVNLCSSDVRALTRTLERHFDYRVVEIGTVPDHLDEFGGGSEFSLLTGRDGSYLVVSQIDPSEGSAYPPHFHIGVMQDSADAVHAKREELFRAGYAPTEIGASFEALGAEWTAFSCPVGDGLEIEVNHRTWSAVLDA